MILLTEVAKALMGLAPNLTTLMMLKASNFVIQIINFIKDEWVYSTLYVEHVEA